MTNEELFQEIGYLVCDEDLVLTAETFADFNSSRQGYAEIGTACSGEVEGFSYIEFLNVQVRKGQPRKDIIVIDLGDHRVVYAA